MEPVAEELAEQLEDGAQDEQEPAAGNVAAQRRLGRTQLVAIPIVFTPWPGAAGRSLGAAGRLPSRIKRQGLTDALTGPPNRTLLYDRADQAMRQADRELAPAALALIDLDRFKEVNDTLGHHSGDQLTPWPASAATSSRSSSRASRPERVR